MKTKQLLLICAAIFTFGSLQLNAQGCQASFTQDSTACPNVSFTDQSTSSFFPIVEWYWNFGDGNTSNVQNPSHTYAADGQYTVCLTTISADSCASTFCMPVSIACIGGGSGSSCQAMFYQDSTASCPTYAFSDQSTTSTYIVEWYWNFGDGNTSNLQNPTHTYAADGQYNVCLTTVSADSCVSTYCSGVNVNCIGGSGSNCQAMFYQDSTSACPTISFVDQSTSSFFPIVEWYWNFGDGSTSNVQNPTHTYSADGTYDVCLVTISADSCVSTHCSTVNINCVGTQPCSAGFTHYQAVDTTGNGGTIVWVTNTSTGNNLSYFWDFGDGNTSTDPYPTHVYGQIGAYQLCLTVDNGAGCTSTYCDSIIVLQKANGFTINVIPQTLDVEEEEVLSELNLYPNPTTANIALDITSLNDSEVQIAIMNLAGQIVMHNEYTLNEGHNKIDLQTSDLTNGYYFVRILSGDSASSELLKFIKK